MATASHPDLSEAAGLEALLPAGMAGLLAQARTALENSDKPNADVLEVAEQLGRVVDRLDIVATNLEMALEMFGRLPAAFNMLADNVNALTAAGAKPLGRLGLILANVPKV